MLDLDPQLILVQYFATLQGGVGTKMQIQDNDSSKMTNSRFIFAMDFLGRQSPTKPFDLCFGRVRNELVDYADHETALTGIL